MTEKSDYWLLDVKALLRQKVSFEEPLSLAEAIEAFAAGDYEDVTDIDTCGEEAVSGVPIGDVIHE